MSTIPTQQPEPADDKFSSAMKPYADRIKALALEWSAGPEAEIAQREGRFGAMHTAIFYLDMLANMLPNADRMKIEISARARK